MLPAAVHESLDASLIAALRGFLERRLPPDEVDDALQDTLERMVRHGAALREPQRVMSWVYRIARNVAADRHRSRARPLLEPESEEPPPREIEPLLRWLRFAIEALPEPYATTLRLTELDQRGHAEVAAELGISLGAVKSRVHRGRALLRQAMLRCCEVELDARGGVMGFRPRQCGC